MILAAGTQADPLGEVGGLCRRLRLTYFRKQVGEVVLTARVTLT